MHVKPLQSISLKSTLLFFVFVSAIFLGGTRAEAASATWYDTFATEFDASTDKDTYNPGDTVTVQVDATNCLCSGTLAAASAYFPSSTLVTSCRTANPTIDLPPSDCSCKTCTSTSTFTAPTTPAPYTISLTGYHAGYFYSGMSITVVAPPSPTVNIYFSFLNKVVDLIKGKA